VAALLGLPVDDLMARYLAQREFVAASFDAIFLPPDAGARNGESQAPLTDEALLARLTARGFKAPQESAARVRTLLGSRRVLAASEAARGSIERLLERAIEAIGARRDEEGAVHDVGADEVLARFVQLLDVVAGRSTYIALLNQYPQAFARVLRCWPPAAGRPTSWRVIRSCWMKCWMTAKAGIRTGSPGARRSRRNWCAMPKAMSNAR
jgi:[glutamine synthetase] adenylyltransferase / [glutamine synthetase]-adenylyl-L-tyrosine phosphorylase